MHTRPALEANTDRDERVEWDEAGLKQNRIKVSRPGLELAAIDQAVANGFAAEVCREVRSAMAELHLKLAELRLELANPVI